MKYSSITIERLINIVIVLAGILIIIIGIANPNFDTTVETIFVSIGASMLASAIVSFFSSIYIQKYTHAKEISEIWGISSISDKRNVMNERIDAQIDKTRNQYDIIAFGLKSLREGYSEGVENCLKRGTHIRIITVNPNNPRLETRDKEEKKASGSTKLSIIQLAHWVDELNTKYHGQVQIRYSDTIPTEYYCREDNYIYVGPYQYGKESQQMITMEYRSPGKAFEYYDAYFQSLWDDTEYCSEKANIPTK